jgi:acyl phosphate:glycerol-3-phosphate acyltransferase
MNATSNLWMPIAMVIAAYLLGSVAFAIVISKIMGIADPRTFGSRNPGATNVLRSGKRSAAIATLVLDALKGFIPVLLMLRFATE